MQVTPSLTSFNDLTKCEFYPLWIYPFMDLPVTGQLVTLITRKTLQTPQNSKGIRLPSSHQSTSDVMPFKLSVRLLLCDVNCLLGTHIF